ncbi:hypothetical protein VFMJ11_1725 [Aliivibrio fischeri MJ11]|uniref:Response regulator n=1 Tax=Aliivibrio fischeri (strain MJ11) TaxID=388396 RepID=B5FF44_ALIFM|nr:response regulator transcription factor [Aliivibrio fischeri]ACH65337.1 hypothetical protein VFMJ11_1725 [Aliivibrio fischeri MJ11]
MKYSKILLIEDGEYKSERVMDFLRHEAEIKSVTLRQSYSSAVKELVDGDYDFAVIDMSLPTFDQNSGEISDDFRAFAGLDIARQIVRRKIDIEFIFLTQYQSLTDDSNSMNIQDIDLLASDKYEGKYQGCIYYEHAGSSWKEHLKKVLTSD